MSQNDDDVVAVAEVVADVSAELVEDSASVKDIMESLDSNAIMAAIEGLPSADVVVPEANNVEVVNEENQNGSGNANANNTGPPEQTRRKRRKFKRFGVFHLLDPFINN